MPYKNKEDQKRNHRRWHLRNQTVILRKQRDYRFRIKKKVLTYYSGEKPKCACCGEETIEFLSIDHINGDGTRHRKAIGRSRTYLWLIKNKFPEGFRVLCYNCNQAMSSYGKCPHKNL